MNSQSTTEAKKLIFKEYPISTAFLNEVTFFNKENNNEELKGYHAQLNVGPYNLIVRQDPESRYETSLNQNAD